MPKYRTGVALSGLLLVATWMPTGAAAQDDSQTSAVSAIECGGQYECLQYGVLTAAEARTCLGHPEWVATPALIQVSTTHLATPPPRAGGN
jgi:hypothetical protein